MFKQLQFFFIVLLSFLSFTISLAQTGPGESSPKTSETNSSPQSSSPLSGLNIQILPAFYLNTWAVDLNVPINNQITVGLSYSSTFGNNTGDKQHFVIAQDYTKQGMRLQLSGKFFLSQKAPEGFYGHVQVSYNTLVYYDGSTRPFSLFNHRKDISGVGNGELVSQAKKVDMGVGFGYQAIIIPNHIIANMLVGIQGNQSSDNELFMNIYIRPTIGFVF